MFHAGTVGGTAFRVYAGTRAAPGNEILDVRAESGTDVEMRSQKGLKLS